MRRMVKNKRLLKVNGLEVTLVRSKQKTLSIRIKPDNTVMVKAPLNMAEAEIIECLQKKEGWIRKHLRDVEELSKLQKFSKEELAKLKAEAEPVIKDRVEYYSKIVDVSYGKITIRSQKTRWGSCSANGNLNFNCLLLLAPPEVLDSVVVHELCHRKIMNHSKAFYEEVYKAYPEYDKCNKWLKDNGKQLIARL